jgi:NADPH:quinone reductase-like Zn-dependent oxidoreductase
LEAFGTIEGTGLMLWGASSGVDRIALQFAKHMDAFAIASYADVDSQQ